MFSQEVLIGRGLDLERESSEQGFTLFDFESTESTFRKAKGVIKVCAISSVGRAADS